MNSKVKNSMNEINAAKVKKLPKNMQKQENQVVAAAEAEAEASFRVSMQINASPLPTV